MAKKSDFSIDFALHQVAVIYGFLIGLASVFAVRWVLFQQTGSALIGFEPSLTLLLETGAAMGLSFMVCALLPFRSFAARLAQIAGVALMAVSMHIMVHAAPSAFASLFSPDWVENVIENTEANKFFYGTITQSVAVGFTEPDTNEMIFKRAN